MNLYLDIDGVLLTKRQKAAQGVEQFLRFVTQHFNCFWLTTHCRAGENKAVSYLAECVSEELLPTFHLIQATNWHTLKTEAIDFSEDFIWLDDAPFNSEKQVLSQLEK